MSKKKTALIASIICILVLAGAGTVAFYTTTSDVAKNTVKASNLKVEMLMLEEDDEGNRSEVSEGSKINPGESASRIAIVKNTGKQAAWIRVSPDLVVDEKIISGADNPYMTFDGLDTENWKWSDGYFYYSKPLESGEYTTPLFTGVRLKPEVNNDMSKKSIYLKPSAQGTQVKHNGSTALEAKGWPEE